MAQCCFPSGCFPASKPKAAPRKEEVHAGTETLVRGNGNALIVHGQKADETSKFDASDTSSTASDSRSPTQDFTEPAEEPSPEAEEAPPSRFSSAVGSQVFTTDFAELFANLEEACFDHQAATEASKLLVRQIVVRALDRQQNLIVQENESVGESKRVRTESELAKALVLRRAGTTNENEPAASSADARHELALFTVDETAAGGIAAGLRHETADTQLAALLQLRRAGTTHENHPEQRVVECAAEDTSPVKHTKPSKQKRHDFGIGIARCIVCKSIPRCNRGCASCNQRICRRCFPDHVCQDLAGAQELADEDARSTPSVKI